MAAHAALRRALRDFSAPEPAVWEAAPQPAPPGEAPPADIPAPIDTAALVAEAVREAQATLAARLGAQHQSALAALQAAYDQAMAEQMTSFGESMLARVDMALGGLARALSTEMEQAVAGLLAPMLGEIQAARAADALRQAVLEAVADPAGVALVLRGPEALRARIEEPLRDAGFAVRWQNAEGWDVEASVGQALWRTRLGEWRDGLDSALGAEAP